MAETRREENASPRCAPIGTRLQVRGPASALLLVALLAAFLAAQGAALAHAHFEASHDGPCAICRVADDTTHALESPLPSPIDVPTALAAPAAHARNDLPAPRRRAHPPRAPPIV